VTDIKMPTVKIGEPADPRIAETKDADRVKTGAGMKKIHFTQHAK
jgi:hypothetical protein